MLLSLAINVSAQNVRLSFKLLGNPADGSTPSWVSPGWIDSCVMRLNIKMGELGRGISFSSEPVTTVLSSFYDDSVNAETKDELEFFAELTPSYYQWREDRINIYLSSGVGWGGYCSFPEPHDDEVILIGANGSSFRTVLHEIGHFFDLCHTQGCYCDVCPSCSVPGTDEIDDTLPDRACWLRNGISQFSYSLDYAQLSPELQERVDDVFLNVMSYHNGFRLTEDQLDHWATAIYSFASRRDVVGGDPIFIDDDASCSVQGIPCALCTGLPAAPYDDLIDCGFGNVDSPGDVIVLRPGTYNILDNTVINTPCLVAGTNAGTGVIK